MSCLNYSSISLKHLVASKWDLLLYQSFFAVNHIVSHVSTFVEALFDNCLPLKHNSLWLFSHSVKGSFLETADSSWPHQAPKPTRLPHTLAATTVGLLQLLWYYSIMLLLYYYCYSIMLLFMEYWLVCVCYMWYRLNADVVNKPLYRRQSIIEKQNQQLCL